MKIIAVLIVFGLAILACGCTTQVPVTPPTVLPTAVPTMLPAISTDTDARDLIGVWVGTDVRYADPYDFRENVSIRYNITGQTGPTFGGVKEFTKQSDGKTYTKNFTGVRTSSGMLYFSDEDMGYNIGRMTEHETLEIIHLVDGSIDYPRSWSGTFKRPSDRTETTTPVTITNITGTWVGKNVSYLRPGKYPGVYFDDITVGLTITTQKGPVFTGLKEIYKPLYGKTFPKNFTGVISSDGVIYLADEGQGYSIGKFIAPGTLELAHIADGSMDYQNALFGRFNQSAATSSSQSIANTRNITGRWLTKNASISILPVGSYDNLSVTYEITAQNGSIFEGVKEFVKPSNSQTYTKYFTGVITSSGDVYISDEGRGYNIGRFLDVDTLEVVHMADGTGAYPKAWVGILTRQKS